MRAMVIKNFGGPDVFEQRELPTPQPGPGELLVRVYATSVNPVDYKIRHAGQWAGIEPPAIIGYDVAGVVESIGTGVDAFAPGDAVFYTPEIFGVPGSYAEFHVTDASIVAKKPANLTYLEAASIPLAGCTAWDAIVERSRVRLGETVLIHAGAGGVGSLAVQLAKGAGARVIATAAASAHELVRTLGADVTIDYRTEDFVARTLEATGGTGADVVFDTVGGTTVARSIDAAARDARIVTIVDVEGDLNGGYAKNVAVHFHFMQRSGRTMAALRSLLERGALRPVIDSVLPLERVGEAHAKIERGGMRGKLVLEVDPRAKER